MRLLVPPCSMAPPLVGSRLSPATSLLIGRPVNLGRSLSVVPVPPMQARRRPARRTLTARPLKRGLRVLQVHGRDGRAQSTPTLSTAGWLTANVVQVAGLPQPTKRHRKRPLTLHPLQGHGPVGKRLRREVNYLSNVATVSKLIMVVIGERPTDSMTPISTLLETRCDEKRRGQEDEQCDHDGDTPVPDWCG